MTGVQIETASLCEREDRCDWRRCRSHRRRTLRVYVDGQKHLLSALNTKQNHLCPIEMELIEPVKAVFLFSAWQGLQIEAVQVYNHSLKGICVWIYLALMHCLRLEVETWTPLGATHSSRKRIYVSKVTFCGCALKLLPINQCNVRKQLEMRGE